VTSRIALAHSAKYSILYNLLCAQYFVNNYRKRYTVHPESSGQTPLTSIVAAVIVLTIV
jgi:hypothetical protein